MAWCPHQPLPLILWGSKVREKNQKFWQPAFVCNVFSAVAGEDTRPRVQVFQVVAKPATGEKNRYPLRFYKLFILNLLYLDIIL